LSEGYGVSIHWLMTGQGEKYLPGRADVEVATAVDEFRVTPPHPVEWEEPPPDLAYGWEVDPWSVIRLKGLSERIVEARGDIPVKDMAERVSLELSLYKAIEDGSIFPSQETLLRIVAATAVDARWLASGATFEKTIAEYASRLNADISTIGSRIKTIRNKMGMTQAQFAEHVDVGFHQLVSVEIGRVQPSVEVVKKVVEATDASVHWLIFGEEETPEFEVKIIARSLKHFLELEETKLVMSPTDEEISYLQQHAVQGGFISTSTWKQILLDYRRGKMKKE